VTDTRFERVTFTCVLADIFNGVITTWDDAAILEIQDGDFDPPSGEKIVVYHRTYGSSTTKGITQYLHAA
jgi:ABC-type phosphate transport system substrate-binding protein